MSKHSMSVAPDRALKLRAGVNSTSNGYDMEKDKRMCETHFDNKIKEEERWQRGTVLQR